MRSEALPLGFFSNLDMDFRAEVVAAELVEQGVPEDRIVIMLLGAMKRSFRKDVEGIEEELSAYDHKEYTVIKSPKEGFYDMLPEGLFHDPSAHRSARSRNEIIKAMQQRKEEELNARRFFLPLEATINYLRMQMALLENRLDKPTVYEDLTAVFSDHWEIFQYLDARQANTFLHLIPILHELRDNHPVIETVLNVLFQVPIQLALRTQVPIRPAAPIVSKLGNSGLGVDLTTGNALYSDGEDELLITIGPISSEVYQQFRPGGSKHRILELLIDYLLPVHLDVVTEFTLQETSQFTRLSEGVSGLNALLGTDTYL